MAKNYLDRADVWSERGLRDPEDLLYSWGEYNFAWYATQVLWAYIRISTTVTSAVLHDQFLPEGLVEAEDRIEHWLNRARYWAPQWWVDAEVQMGKVFLEMVKAQDELQEQGKNNANFGSS